MRGFIVCLFLVLVFPLKNALSEVSRIDNFNVDRKKVNRIYLSYSKTGLIRFPDLIEEVRVGAPEGYKYEISKTYKRELSLKLKNGSNAPSNLIVRTSNEDIYVFDLIPSKIRHQDVVFVDESFYRTKLNMKSPIKRKRIYSHRKIQRLSLTKGPRTLIYSNRPKRESLK